MAKKTDKDNKAVAPIKAQGVIENITGFTEFFDRVANIIEQARRFVGRTADLTLCITYFEIGRLIVEKEQDGKTRAEYGKGLIKDLSAFLNGRFKKGFSESTLKYARQFYVTYAEQIRQTIFGELNGEEDIRERLSLPTIVDKQAITSIRQTFFGELESRSPLWRSAFKLGWSHYLVLMGIENENERQFYEIEAEREGWTVAQLKRQYHSSLYERLALSRDKNEVMRLSREGQVIEKPQDILKNPLVLEFLGMAEDAAYSESDLENAIISKLQAFLLELGKGFLFEARQKRFTFDEQSFFVDIVFYNRLLQCYVLVDLKTEELKHQDLGQMQMYVNYFDRFVKKDFEKPTVGILLCKKRNNGLVELTLPKDSQIYASAYSLYLPDKTLLQSKLAEWIQEFEDEHGTGDDKK
jgi:predicted nuclease of restriction endonuclease-like (RecB) superfamily